MTMLKVNSLFQTPEALEQLIHEVVSWESRTGTQGEIDFPYRLKEKLLELSYFQKNPLNIHLMDAGNDRNTVAALYKSSVTDKTIVLISHYDTVHVEEFGTLKPYAFDTYKMTEEIKKIKNEFTVEVQKDIDSNEYIFGRGIMDMKMGLCLHIHLLEKAAIEQWPINLLLLSVPDEEVNSSGMREGVKGLVKLREQYRLHYVLFLNGEPTFSQYPGDEQYYIYSGSIGKIMPSALFFGKGTHAGEPMQGITGHYMASFLTQEMEYNEFFRETAFGEQTPLPICLQQQDLKLDYSTQTSHHVSALYNVFIFKQNASDVLKKFKQVAEHAMHNCHTAYKGICTKEEIHPIGDIKVLEYKELLTYVQQKLGNAKVAAIIEQVNTYTHLDERQKSVFICDEFMANCQELAPATVIFFAPPYYPPVNSTDNKFIIEKVQLVEKIMMEEHNVSTKLVHYFNGISDLSYVNYDANDQGWLTYCENTPVWNTVYSIPFKEMQQLNAPVMNVGPFGKDAHKLTERLHKKSAFVYLPNTLSKLIQSIF